MADEQNNLFEEVACYYSEKLAEFGDTPRGVDWNGKESQFLRFKQLLKIVDTNSPFSLNDLGCGYGALLEYLNKGRLDFRYIGYDISSAMIDTAKSRYSQIPNVQFIKSSNIKEIADYCVASGIFNVKLNYSDNEWWEYLTTTLDMLHNTSHKGFAFNCLTLYSDAEKMRNYLYYADPCVLFDLCKRRYSRNVALLHDYGLYEFTIAVKKS